MNPLGVAIFVLGVLLPGPTYALCSSHGSVIFSDVCDPCVPKVERIILNAFRKATPLRREHGRSLPQNDLTAQQLAQDEEDAIERARDEGRL